MLIFIFTHQTMAQGAAEASSNEASRRETVPEQLAMESYTSYHWSEDWPGSAYCVLGMHVQERFTLFPFLNAFRVEDQHTF